MNKKFSTLMASLLLAGGLFSTADAADIKDVAGTGKYYQMLRTSQYSSVPGWHAPDTKMFLVQNGGEAYVSSSLPTDKRATYWKVEKSTLPGSSTQVYKFINQLGETLTYTDVAGNKQTEFYTSFSTGANVMENYDANTILQTAAGNGDAHIYMSYSDDNAKNLVAWKAYTLLSGQEYALAFDFVEPEGETYDAATLNAYLGSTAGFRIQIGDLKTAGNDNTFAAYTNLQGGEVFSGILKASTAAVDATVMPALSERFYSTRLYCKGKSFFDTSK